MFTLHGNVLKFLNEVKSKMQLSVNLTNSFLTKYKKWESDHEMDSIPRMYSEDTFISWEQDVTYYPTLLPKVTSGHQCSILLQVCYLRGPRDALTQWSPDEFRVQWMRGIFCRASWGQEGKPVCTGQQADWEAAAEMDHFTAGWEN